MKFGVDCFSFVFKVLWAQYEPVRSLSNIKPRYFIEGVVGITLLLSDTERQSLSLRENMIKDDFDSFIFIFQGFDHNLIKFG